MLQLWQVGAHDQVLCWTHKNKIGFVRRWPLTKANVAQLGPNLISFECKVGTNVIFYLLDSKATYSFINPSAIEWLGWIGTKVVKPIKVQLGLSIGVLGTKLNCGGIKIEKYFMMCKLNNFETIINTIHDFLY